MGVGVSIDDFGTGRSSLGCLHHFPIDTVKIDRSLFQPAEDGELAAIVRGLLEMATTMGLTAVAEGIESPDQVERLVRGGCPLGQGHLFAPALDAPSAIAYAQWRAPGGGPRRASQRAA
jgi:EAL domain-containing protein (putative c-di-GMP-specific phosphodiesterase class I)